DSDNQFLCPCHAAAFDFYGHFQGPPVPRPLDTFRVSFEETAVLVDTSLPQRRDSYQPDQLAYCPADSQTARSG
nr:Rieske 2Fe-2S domain-containing protein [Anaerolineae bacterium]